MRRARSFWKAKGGAAAAEFALVTPFLLMLLFGAFEYGRYLWTVNALQQTAAQTARCIGMLEPNVAGSPGCAANAVFSPSTAKLYGETLSAAWGITLADSNLTVSNAATCGNLTDFSQASISYVFNSYVPAILPSMAQGYTITTSACFPNQT